MKTKLTFLLLLNISSVFSQIQLVKDINPGTTSSFSANFQIFKGNLLFTANNGTNGLELWQTDGSEANTTLLKDFNLTGDGFPYINSSAILNDIFYFSANSGTGSGGSGREIWKTNGTTAGTVLIKDIRTGTTDSNPSNFITFNNEVLFSANNGTIGAELWKTDGTEANTLNLVDQIGTNNNLSQFIEMNGYIYFTQTAGGLGKELYRTNGQTGQSNTTLVKDIFPGTTGSFPTAFVIFKSSANKLYFPANGNNGAGSELWVSDGTNAGTVMVKDINPGTNDSDIFKFCEYNGFVYFSAYDGYNDVLWKSDGTTAGTTKVFNNSVFDNNGLVIGTPQVIDNMLYFWASNSTNANGNMFDFYKFDGTTLTKLLDLNSSSAQEGGLFKIGTKIYFSAPDPTDSFYQLWQTDGTPAGTISVASQFTSSINPGNITDLIALNDVIYFRGEMPATGIELYKYDPATLFNNQEFNNLTNISLFPNPSINGVFTISGLDNVKSNYEIYNVLGKKISNGIIENNKLNINAASGVYLIKIVNDRGSVTKKIIIK